LRGNNLIERRSKMQEREYIKDTKYCQILAQSRVTDGVYTYSIEKVYVKKKKRDEIRFCLYKDTLNQIEKYVPRSLDVTELELLDLFKEAINQDVFSTEMLGTLKGILSQKRVRVLKVSNAVTEGEETNEKQLAI